MSATPRVVSTDQPTASVGAEVEAAITEGVELLVLAFLTDADSSHTARLAMPARMTLIEDIAGPSHPLTRRAFDVTWRRQPDPSRHRQIARFTERSNSPADPGAF